ncbi:MAG: DUF2357 domain-containing protein [Planctomycetes bacterium]|nr:DUF2357 domain-containing protein [Planctomycetota bacterium]
MSTDPGRSPALATIEILRGESGRLARLVRSELDLGSERGAEPAGSGGPYGPEAQAQKARQEQQEQQEEQGVLETDRLAVTISAPRGVLDSVEVRLAAGNVAVASTRPEGPDELRLARPAPERLELTATQIFLDCAGESWLEVLTRWSGEDEFRPVARIPLSVRAAKIDQEELERLIADLEEASRDVLFEAYAKTSVALRASDVPRRRAPAEKLERIRGLLLLFGAELARISNRPAQRLALSPRRVGVYPGEPITPETLASMAEDTTLLARTRVGVLPRERIEMAAERDVELPEHAAIAGFLARLDDEVREVASALASEVQFRKARRRIFAPGEGGIWSQREEPRIQALQGLEAKARVLLSTCRDLRRKHEFLPPDPPPLGRPPDLTKRFAHVGGYSVLYRAMREHFQGTKVDLEGGGVLVAAKSLPVLWEYWTVLKVIRFLQRRLRYAAGPWDSSASLFRRVLGPRDRYVLELAGDRRLEFLDAAGRRVLFRYQPRYWPMHRARADYGRLQRRGAPYEPDMAIEVYAAGDEAAGTPEHILVLDAKYASRSHADLLDSVARYRNIGELRTGVRLARQIWAVTNAPKAPGAESSAGSPLEEHVTVDNEAFLEEGFSALGEVCGVICVRPGQETGQDPLGLLLGRLFGILGVQ